MLSTSNISTPGISILQQRFILTIFASTLFTSAFLLFWVEPLIGKMLLPLLGGSPVVWNTCMMFFQGILLLGYCYVHITRRLLSLQQQIFLHTLLIIVALATLPIAIPQTVEIQNLSNPIPWLLWLLFSKTGFALFIIASTSPLLQLWFSQTHHAHREDPYFLYAGSNFGSLLALLFFPFLIEPYFNSLTQHHIWMVVFAGVALMTFLSAFFVKERTVVHMQKIARVSNHQRTHWLLLAFAPSCLLLGITNYLTADVAAIPLLWIIPLALYLLTFVFAFSKTQLFSQRWMMNLQPFVLLPLTLLMAFSFVFHNIGIAFAVHLTTFFVCAMICHAELARQRPPTENLTEFYFWIGLGGFLGGFFVTIIAPLVFNSVIEYPIAIALACALRPSDKQKNMFDIIPAGLIFLLFSFLYFAGIRQLDLLLIAFCLSNIVVMSAADRPIRFGLGVGSILAVAILFFHGNNEKIIFHERSYLGTIKILNDTKRNAHLLLHGNTVHGAQFIDSGNNTIESYFGPLLETLHTLENKQKYLNIAVAGLGTGTLACHVRKSDHLTFYEIDPLVKSVAENNQFFSFLSNCPPKGGIIMGDARINLKKAENDHFDLIIIDTFNSNSIPVHLMTREAVDIYLQKLKPNGLLAFNITNRHLKLHYVLAAIADELKLAGAMKFEHDFDREAYKFPSYWVMLSRAESDIAPDWQDLKMAEKRVLWRDDFSNILETV